MTKTQTQTKSPAHNLRWLGCLVVLLGLWTTNSNAQQRSGSHATSYNFTQGTPGFFEQNGVVAPFKTTLATGAAAFTSTSNAFLLPTGFTYTINGTAYVGTGAGFTGNAFNINSNGWLSFNNNGTVNSITSPTASTTSPLTVTTSLPTTTGAASSATAQGNGAIFSAMGRAMVANAAGANGIANGSECYVVTYGDGRIVVEWRNMKPSSGTTGRIDYEFIVYPDNYLGNGLKASVEYRYANIAYVGTASTAQVGVRGWQSVADVQMRASTSSWATTTLATADASTTTIAVSLSATIVPATGLSFTYTPCVVAPSFASLPYSQGFESTWINSGCGSGTTQDIADNSWRSGPLFGETSWRRNGGEATAYWLNIGSGAPPSGYTGTGYADFHTYAGNNNNAGQIGVMDLFLNIPTGAANLTFKEVNTSGTDVLRVRVSTDGGLTFPTLLTPTAIGVNAAWTPVALAVTGSATTVIRFEAAGDWGTTDIAIDDISVTAVVTPPNCAASLLPANGATNQCRNMTLTWANGGGAPSGYRLTFGTNSPTYDNILNNSDLGNVTSYNAGLLTASTVYGYTVVPYNPNGPAVGCSMNTFTTGTSICYCTPTTPSGLTYYVTNLTTTGGTTNINNTSGSSATGYQDFSGSASMSAPVNTVINFSITVAGGSTYGKAIWIDYNQDGTFAAGEQVASSAAYVSSPVTGSFTVSPSATLGTTRMRIVATFTPNNPSNPCANTGDGEYEDYAFTVLAPPPPAITSFNPSTACSGATVVITGTGFTGATAVTFGGTNAQSFIVNSATQITAVVSTSGSSGLVSVTTPNGTGSSGGSFTFNGIGPVTSIQEGSSFTLCAGNSQTLTALPTGGGETYLWSTNETTQAISVSSAGTYTVTVTNFGGCTNTASATITIIPLPSGVTATPSANPVCSGAPFNLTSTGTTTGTATILSENFESGAPGWSFLDSSSTGAAILTQQVWHIQTSPYTDATGSITFLNYSMGGTKFAYTNADAGGSGSFTRTFMVSPSFSTVGYSGNGTLSFSHLYEYWGSSAPPEEVNVQISINGGTTWTTLQSYQGANVGTVTNNAEVPAPGSVTVPSIYMGQPNVKLRFRYITNWGYVWAMDNILLTATPLPTFSWTSSPAGFTSGVQNPTGVTQTADRSYTVVATGQGGCTSSASTAIVTTNTAPVIGTCPGDITQCDNHVATWTDPTATGTPTPTVVCSPASGSTFATGTTLVTCTATNSCSPSSSCSFNVTINETPVIVCPGDINDNTTSLSGKVETYTAPSGGTPSATATCTPPSGSTFPIGTTTVNCSATNSCGTGTCSFDVNITFICTPPSISACPGDISQCDNHVATWTDPTATGGIPTATVTCVPASGSTFATGTTLVTCTASNGCAPDASCSFNVTINETPVIAACPGDITQCDNHVATWTDPTATGTPAATVVCSPLSGSTFATGTTLVTCTATNSCGTDDCSFNVTINESATAPTSVTTDDGDNEICTSGTITLTANGGTLGSPAGTYTWYEGGCGTGSIIGTGTTLVRGPGLSVGTHVYYVRINQAACGNTTCASVSVVVTGAPPATNVPFPTVPAYACSGNNLPASTSPVTYATTYTWDGPVGTTFNSVSNPYASGSTSVTVNYGAPNGSGYNICVQGSNACGTTTRRCSFVRGTVNVPGTITAANNRTIECPSTSAGYSIAAVGGATSYTWSITGNATVVGSGTSATVNFGAGWTSGTLSVTANTPCYSSAPRSLALSNVTALPGAISGPASVCPGGPAQVYSVPAVAGASTYNWVLPANATGSSSSNSISVTFLTGYTFGDIKVSITSICGNTSAQQAKTVTTGIPNQPASVSGNASGLCNQTTVYSCPSVTGASSYTWSVSGGSINSGQGSTSINVTFGAFVNGNVCVTANNGCGSSAPRCLPVIAKPAISGNITYTPGTICANQSGVDFQINPVYGTSGYNWIFPSGVSVVLDLGNEQIVNWGTNSGVVSVTAANACGSATKTTTITLTCREAATETIESNSSVSVYPNPAHDRINVQFNATEKTNYVLNLMDLSGRVMSTTNATAQKGMNTSELNLSTLAKGVYMIEVRSDLINKQIRVVIE